MRVLVTGAAGFIGSNLAQTLAQRGDRVVGFDNLDDYYSPALKSANVALLEGAGGAFHLGDVRDGARVEAVLRREEPEAIVHLAARPGVRASFENPALYEDVNEAGTEVLLRCAARQGIRRLVFASSSSVYGDAPIPFREAMTPRPISPYAETKLAGEALVRDFHRATAVPSLCLRFFTVYGPRQRPDLALRAFTAAIEAGEPVNVYGDGSSRRDYTWVGDACSAILAALEAPCGFEIVNVGSARPVRLAELLQLLERVLGRKAAVRHLERARGDLDATCADLTKASRLLGYRPRMAIEEGVARFVDWYRAQPAGTG